MSTAAIGEIESRLRDRPRGVVLAGNYGAGNLGDELLLQVMAGWVRAVGGNPSAISVHPQYTARVRGVQGVDYADAVAVVRALATSDLLVMGGGGLLQDYDVLDEDAFERFPAFGATQFAQYTLLAATLGLPYAAIGQGVGPLRSDTARRIVRHVFASANAASLRDEDSARLLRDVGCAIDWPVAPDPAWAWQPAQTAPQSPAMVDNALQGCKVLALNLREWPHEEGWEERFAAALPASLPSGWACLWIDFRSALPGDAQEGSIAKRMAGSLPGCHAVWTGDDPDELWRILAGCDAVLAMRMHGALLAHLAGRPTITLEYEAKVGALAADAGMPEVQRVPLARIDSRLSAAIAAATGASAHRLDRSRGEDIARRALMHRDMLWRVMDSTAGAPEAAPRTRWLARWATTATAPELVDALELRLHRALDQQAVAMSQVAQAREDAGRRIADVEKDAALARDALTQAVAAAREDATRWQVAYGHVVASRAYRYTAPARRIAEAWRAWQTRRRQP